MHVDVLCPMLTSQLFIRGPAPCKGPVSTFAYKQFQLEFQLVYQENESKVLLLGIESSKQRIKKMK